MSERLTMAQRDAEWQKYRDAPSNTISLVPFGFLLTADGNELSLDLIDKEGNQLVPHDANLLKILVADKLMEEFEYTAMTDQMLIRATLFLDDAWRRKGYIDYIGVSRARRLIARGANGLKPQYRYVC